MTADKTIEILEELKKDFENKCNSSMNAGDIEALDMAITMLEKDCDLASQNDELKRLSAELEDHMEKAKKEISLTNEYLKNARFENQNLKVQCDTYEKCLSLIVREVVK